MSFDDVIVKYGLLKSECNTHMANTWQHTPNTMVGQILAYTNANQVK